MFCPRINPEAAEGPLSSVPGTMLVDAVTSRRGRGRKQHCAPNAGGSGALLASSLSAPPRTLLCGRHPQSQLQPSVFYAARRPRGQGGGAAPGFRGFPRRAPSPGLGPAPAQALGDQLQVVAGGHELFQAGQLADARGQPVEVQLVGAQVQPLELGQLADGRLEAARAGAGQGRAQGGLQPPRPPWAPTHGQ